MLKSIHHNYHDSWSGSEAARRSKGAGRCADSGLSHGELLREEDHLKSGDSELRFDPAKSARFSSSVPSNDRLAAFIPAASTTY
jgi:hypothetical protein